MTTANHPKAPDFAPHDHGRCKDRALQAAMARCAREKLRMTPLRARVLEILLEGHQAQGAYDILARLAQDGHPAQPPMAYRALDFLVSHGFAHRIERRNAYIACTHPDDADHAPAFLICRACDHVAEAEAGPVESQLDNTARAMGFAIERASVEVEGLCPNCAPEAGQ